MTFSLDAGTLLVGALIFLLAVFVKPLVMYWRDKVVWMWMEKYLINKKLFDDIDKFAIEYHLRPVRGMFTLLYYFDEESNKFRLRSESEDVDTNSLTLTKGQMSQIEADYSKRSEWYRDMSIRIKKASTAFDRLTKHYSQDTKEVNIVDEYRENLLAGQKESTVGRKVLYVISEIHSDPIEWRKQQDIKWIQARVDAGLPIS